MHGSMQRCRHLRGGGQDLSGRSSPSILSSVVYRNYRAAPFWIHLCWITLL